MKQMTLEASHIENKNSRTRTYVKNMVDIYLCKLYIKTKQKLRLATLHAVVSCISGQLLTRTSYKALCR